MVSREVLVTVAREAVGVGALALIAVGVWGRFGWEWAAIVAGLPFAAFYVRGEWVQAGTNAQREG